MFNILTAAAETPNYDSNQLLMGLVIGVFLLVILIVKTKVHPFMALIISAMVIALIGGVPADLIPSMITDGFGSTLGKIGIIVGLGIIMGQILEKAGAAERMALTFIKIFGKGRENLALAITGFIVAIPVFCDSGFIILFPIAKAISEKTRKNLVTLGGALALGLVLTHSLVPPTPGPIAAANEFGIDFGSMFLWGMVIGIPALIAGLIYVGWYGKNKAYVGAIEGTEEREFERQEEINFSIDMSRDEEELPSTFLSFLPILLPIALILLSNLVGGNIINVSGTVAQYISFLGDPVVALTIGTLVSIYTLAYKMPRKEVLADMDAGIKSCGIILLVIGGGGALGQVIKSTGLGDHLAASLTDLGIPLLILPFVIATIIRFIQGSGTVAIITASSISAPIILSANAAGADINLTFAALAACAGSLFFSYFNDAYFHVVNRMIGIKDTKDQIGLWSITTTITWAVSGTVLFILSIFF